MHSLGQIFKQAREAKALTISQAGEGTRIKVQTLEWMEADLWEKMPAPLYARGFIKIYAELLEIDSTPLLGAYNTLLAGKHKKPVFIEAPTPVVPSSPPPPIKTVDVPPPQSAMEKNWGQEALAGFDATPLTEVIQESKPPVSKPATVHHEPLQSQPAQAATPSIPAGSPAVQSDESEEPIDDLFMAKPRIERQRRSTRGSRDSSMLPPEIVVAFWRYVPIGLGILLVVILLLSTLKRCGHHPVVESTVTMPPPKVAPVSSVPIQSKTIPATGQLRLGQEPPVPYFDDPR